MEACFNQTGFQNHRTLKIKGIPLSYMAFITPYISFSSAVICMKSPQFS